MTSMIASTDESKGSSVMIDFPCDIPSIKRMKVDKEAHNISQVKGSFDNLDDRGNSIPTLYARSGTPSDMSYKSQDRESNTLSSDQRDITDTLPTDRIDPVELTRDEQKISSTQRKNEPRRMTVEGRLQEKERISFAIPESYNASWPDSTYREENVRNMSHDESRSSLQTHESLRETEYSEAPPHGYSIQQHHHHQQQQQQQHFVPMPSVVWFNQHLYPPTHPYAQPAVPFPYESQQYWVFPVHTGSPIRVPTTTSHVMPAIDSSATEGASQQVSMMPPLSNATNTPWLNTMPHKPPEGETMQPPTSVSTNYPSSDYMRSSGPSGPSLYSQVTQFTGLSQHHSVLAPYYARAVLSLSTAHDEEWLSEFLCFVRHDCIEVFTAGHEDVASRMNSKKVMDNQVGIRCRFCAHVPHRERAGRSSSFPSSISRIYQSLTMMLRDHFPKCEHMPVQMKQRYASLKANASQGATDSKRYWIDSAHELGLMDTVDCGIRFNASKGPNDVYTNPSVNYDQPYMF